MSTIKGQTKQQTPAMAGRPPHTAAPADAAPALRRVTALAVAVAVVLVVAKGWGYYQTQATSLLSSLLDSLFDVGMSGINFFAVRYALKPADNEHRFGHTSIEDLAGLAQFAFIFGLMALVVVESVRELINGAPITRPGYGIGVMVGSMALTTALLLYQRRVYRQTGSLVVQADALHYFSDVLMNAGIIVSLLVSLWAGIDWLDPLLAIAIALYVIRHAWHIGERALNNLMDREMPDACRARIEAIIARHEAVHSVHRLRTRQSGIKPFIEMDVWMNGQLTLAQAHALTDALEADLRMAFPQADIMIHQEPIP